MDLIRIIFAKNLLDLRTGLGVSQAYIAQKIGVSTTTYTRWETSSNWPDTASIEKLAEFFNVRSSRLFFDPELDRVNAEKTYIPKIDSKEIIRDLKLLLEKYEH